MVLYAQYYEQMLWFYMLGIMNKRYGSYARYYGQNVRVQYVPHYEINVMVWYAQYFERNVRVH